MLTDDPPRALPEEYHAIWQDLAAADRQPSSRQELARELGVSTETLQRILVRGEVPRFTEEQSTRVRHAWARTLTRLAQYFGREPRSWLQMVGIGWDDTIRRVSSEALRRRPQTRYNGPPAMPPGAQGPQVGDHTATAGAPGFPPLESAYLAPGEPRRPLRTLAGASFAIVDCPPFSTRLPEAGGSFLESIARRLLASVDLSMDVGAMRMSEHEARAAVDRSRRSDKSILAVGVKQTALDGLRHLPHVVLPGLRLHLSAIAIRHRRDTAALPTWDEVATSRAAGDPRFLLAVGDAAAEYVRGQLGIGGDRVTEWTQGEAGDLGDALLGETRRHPRRRTVLVADAPTCRRAAVALSRRPDFAPYFRVEELDGAPAGCPGYPLVIAIPAEWAAWAELLDEVLKGSLLGTYRHDTARLYAELFAIGASCDRNEQAGGNAHPREAGGPTDAVLWATRSPREDGWDVEDFPAAIPGFQTAVCSHLLELLSLSWTSRLAAARERGDPEHAAPAAIREEARALALAQATTLLPMAWRGRLQAPVVGRGPSPAALPRSRYCRSCSVSLLEAQNRGVSSRYCRRCSDEHGRLRLRNEVQVRIADWILQWQEGLSDSEAWLRAELLMKAMPAWNEGRR